MIQVVADGGSVTVSSRLAGHCDEQRWIRHATARVTQVSASPDSLGDGPELWGARTDGNREMPPVSEVQQAWGIEELPFRWTVGSYRTEADQLRADVEVPAGSTAALLDAAVHIGRLVDSDNTQQMVPAGAESVWFEAEFVGDGGCIVARRRSGDDEELVVDIAALAPDGSTCIDIRGLRYVTVGSGFGAGSTGDPRALAHAIEWQLWDDQAGSVPDIRACDAVAVVGEHTAARMLRDRLAEAGYRPTGIDGAQAVVYVPEVGPEDSIETDTDCAVRLSTEVADLVRRLAQQDDRGSARLWIITRGVREGACAAAVRLSCLWGLAGVIKAEQPQLWGGLVDLPAGSDIGDDVPVLARVLGKPSKSILAVRDGEIVTPAVVPVSGEPVREPLRCRPDAAYLITGGMGALGLLMADWLVDRGARRLVLAGRTPLPRRRDWDRDTNDSAMRGKIAAIRALELRGVSVDTEVLDVGSRDAMEAMLARRDDAGEPPIRGVIHAAGVTEGQLLTELEDHRLRRTLWPKVSGAQVLDQIFPPRSLDFLFLTAAAGAVFGIPGQGAYAAANAYLDGMARARHRQGCHTVSLDWVAWQGLGFATDAEVVLQELEQMGSRPITPAEAFPAWEYVDRYDIAQAVMVPMPSDESTVTSDQPSAPVRAWSEMAADDLERQLEADLRAILAHELRLPEAELDVDRPFAELGLNSVMAMSIRREAERLVGIELSATMLWNHPTIASLTAFLAKKLLPQENVYDDFNGIDATDDADGGLLNELFDSVESASAGSEGAF